MFWQCTVPSDMRIPPKSEDAPLELARRFPNHPRAPRSDKTRKRYGQNSEGLDVRAIGPARARPISIGPALDGTNGIQT